MLVWTCLRPARSQISLWWVWPPSRRTASWRPLGIRGKKRSSGLAINVSLSQKFQTSNQDFLQSADYQKTVTNLRDSLNETKNIFSKWYQVKTNCHCLKLIVYLLFINADTPSPRGNIICLTFQSLFFVNACSHSPQELIEKQVWEPPENKKSQPHFCKGWSIFVYGFFNLHSVQIRVGVPDCVPSPARDLGFRTIPHRR